jgi:hypothetical protein
MITKNFTIKQLKRFPKTGDFDELNFQLGVNVLVGEPSTGKTQWLQMFNFLMGAPEIKFNETISDKYDSVEGIFVIGNEEIHLERKWKESGNKTKVFVNGESVSADEFSSNLLTRLNIPVLNYPQSNPLKTWVSLSWRQLLRHIYRRQISWGDLADKQLEIDQHACILMFLGIAEYSFSDKRSQLVESQKMINSLQTRKENYLKTLTEISSEILDGYSSLDNIVTNECLDTSIARLENTLEELSRQRDEVLRFLTDNIQNDSTLEESQLFKQLAEKSTELQASYNSILSQKQEAQSRLEELTKYSQKIQDELDRLERAKSAGSIFRDLRVTHCPVCEKPVSSRIIDPNICYLCKQPNLSDLDDSNISEQRLEFENEQLKEEFNEAEDLIRMVTQEVTTLNREQRTIEEELRFVKHQMKPVQSAAAMILPPEIFQIDIEKGKIYERIRQLHRIKDALGLQENISEEINKIEEQISSLQNEVNEVEENIDFEQSSNFLTANMNEYLELINTWNQGKVSLRLKERSFSFLADANKINSLSATMMMYFLVAYNYGLLCLSNKKQYHYPNFSILEFPANLVDGSKNIEVRNLENFILEPFVKLVNQEGMENTQVIAVGRAFQGLENVHRIELTQVWI